ncbi:MAG: hypothetical protein ACRBG0_06275 [Lewinella sp.]|jgi:hypothetical protein|uniref:hypothetical protein n=1 Tax=Lewinella sp. TaxID=2004506 RepID=UPI003D6A1383
MKTGLSFFALLCCLNLSAQENILNTNGKYLTIGVGIPIHTVRDQAHSPFAYRGSGFRVFTNFEEVKDNGVFRLSFSIESATLKAKIKPRQDTKGATELNNMELSVGYYARVGDDASSDNRQYVGGAYNLQFNNRSYPLPTNNTQSLLFQSSLSVGALDRRSIDGSDRWMATTRIDLPLLTALYRPTYIGIGPFLHIPKVGGKEFFKNLEIVTLNKFFKIAVGVDADHQARDWRTDRIAYDWSLLYTPLPKTKPMIATVGSLGYGFRVLL